MSYNSKDARGAHLAKIHIAKKQLGWDDDTYRATLERLTGKNSAGKLNDIERRSVLAYMAKQGFKPQQKPKKVSTYIKPRNQEEAFMYALWGELKKRGEIEKNAQILAWMHKRNITQIERVEWVTWPVIAESIKQLKQWIARLDRQAKPQFSTIK